jgi:hypothetical protein
VRLGDSIRTLRSRKFGGNGLGGHDCVISLGAGPSISLKKGPFLAKPSSAVGGEMLHDLGSKGESQLVILSSRWRNTTKDAAL